MVALRYLYAYNPPVPRDDEVRRTLRLPVAVDRELAELAHQQRRSMNSAVVVAVERYIRQMKARQPKEGQDAR
jgi:hypothetical protein